MMAFRMTRHPRPYLPVTDKILLAFVNGPSVPFVVETSEVHLRDCHELFYIKHCQDGYLPFHLGRNHNVLDEVGYAIYCWDIVVDFRWGRLFEDIQGIG